MEGRLGRADCLFAARSWTQVHGMDLSVNMVTIALERSRSRSNDLVTFEISDCTTRDFDEESFDVVYSRDTILHIQVCICGPGIPSAIACGMGICIHDVVASTVSKNRINRLAIAPQDKPALFKRLLAFMKPGGRLLISDYCRAETEPTAEFAAYIAQRGYDLHSPSIYGKMLEDAGFVDVVAEDRTDLFETSLRKELALVEAEKDDYIQSFSQADYDAVTGGWKDKLGRLDQQRWGVFTARKANA